jgi:hypothetical protein
MKGRIQQVVMTCKPLSKHMATGRALTTESEREYISGKHGEQRRYEAISRVKSRINQPLTEDIKLFKEHAPKLFDELQEAVCEVDRE